MDSAVITTSNYYSIANEDDIAANVDNDVNEASASESSSQGRDKAAIRRGRIAAAVLRSRSEYHAEHAITERRQMKADHMQHQNPSSKPKLDQQHLEFLVTSLYYETSPDYSRIAALVLASTDPGARIMGGLSRELLDTGLRAAIMIGDGLTAVKLARFGKSSWTGHAAEIAVLSADAFLLAGLYTEAINPVLVSLASFGPQRAILERLERVLSQYQSHLYGSGNSKPNEQLDVFRRLVSSHLQQQRKKMDTRQALLEWLPEPKAQRPSGPPRHTAQQDVAEIDIIARELGLDGPGAKALQEALRRLSKPATIILADSEERSNKRKSIRPAETGALLIKYFEGKMHKAFLRPEASAPDLSTS